VKKYRIKPGADVKIDELDPDETPLLPGGKKAAARENEKLREMLRDLQELLYAERRHRVLIVLQGMDTSGKDSTVRHVMTGFDPAGVRVTSFKRPSEQELAHDYLWRIHANTPGNGEIAVFNRSHYEDVIVVRVHGKISKRICEQRYEQINDFERMLAANDTLILKFFLHISKDEQKKRLQERVDDPSKRWKFQMGDIDERKLWDDYQRAYEDVLSKTSTKWAPWWWVPANTKWYRNFVFGSVIVGALRRLDMKYPRPDLSKAVIE
jgi:PPK2 family polyphosphate:nucleotide phosphotransferase